MKMIGMCTLRRCALPTLLVIVFAGYWITAVYYKIDLRPRTVIYQLLDPPGHDTVGISRRVVVAQLGIIHQQLADAFLHKKAPSARILSQVRELIRRLEPQFDVDTSNGSEYVDTCPEMYMGPKYGHPYFETGWVTQNCSNARPLEDVVSISLFPSVHNMANCSRWLKRVVAPLQAMYPNVTVYLALEEGSCSDSIPLTKSLKVKWVSRRAREKPGLVWNSLISSVSTPYVLIGRDLDHFHWFAALERQIRVVSTMREVKVAGGGFRDSKHLWHAGCYQSDIMNYALKYQDGYFVSKNECMFCDHLLGPFIARTELFKQIKFSDELPPEVLFEDFFLHLKFEQHQVMSCPDVMYFSTDVTVPNKLSNRDSWVSFAKKWKLNEIIWPIERRYTGTVVNGTQSHPDNLSHSFSCSDVGLACNDLKVETQFYMTPPCCIEEFAKALLFLRNFCEQRSLIYQMEAGSVLGAIKTRDLLPWDLDGDLIYFTLNHSSITGSQDLFKNAGFPLSDIENPKCVDVNKNQCEKTGYIQYNTPSIYIEMFGELTMSSFISGFLPNELSGIPTKINIHGVWVNGPANPGLYARNRYGVEILKHAQSWIITGQKSSWEPYIAGRFKTCPRRDYHACLDRFPADGNLLFSVS